MCSVDVAALPAGHSLSGGSSGSSLLLSCASAASVSTRREISQRSIHGRASQRWDLSTPRLAPPRRLVSDATVRRLVRRCREDVADQKRSEDEAEQARIDAAVQKLPKDEETRLAVEANTVRQQEARFTVETTAETQLLSTEMQHERASIETGESGKESESVREETARESYEEAEQAEQIQLDSSSKKDSEQLYGLKAAAPQLSDAADGGVARGRGREAVALQLPELPLPSHLPIADSHGVFDRRKPSLLPVKSRKRLISILRGR